LSGIKILFGISLPSPAAIKHAPPLFVECCTTGQLRLVGEWCKEHREYSMRVENKNDHDLVKDFIKIVNQMKLANDWWFPKYVAHIQRYPATSNAPSLYTDF
jgi:hypothetical protein